MLRATTLCMPRDAAIHISVANRINTPPADKTCLSVHCQASTDPNWPCSSAYWRSDHTRILESRNMAVTAEFASAAAAVGSPLRPGSIKQCETNFDSLSACRPLRKRPYYADPKQGPCSDACWRSDSRYRPEAASAAVRPDVGPAGSAQPAACEGSTAAITAAAAAATGPEQERPAGSSALGRAAADADPAAHADAAAQHPLAGRQRIMCCKADCFQFLHYHGKSSLLQ